MKQIIKMFMFVFVLSLFCLLNIENVKADYEVIVNGVQPCQLYFDQTGRRATGSCIYKKSTNGVNFNSYVSGPVWVDNGDKVTLITTKDPIKPPTTGYGSECKTEFNYISIVYNKTTYYGYVCGDVLEKVEITEEMKKEFSEAGFPESYWDELAVLRKSHPNWSFVAIDTGLDFNTAVKGESYGSRSLFQSTTSANQGYLSTEEGNYDWDTDKFTVYDGSTWYAANSKTIAYYMDPRNFLSDTYIFQFESIVYNEQLHTLEGVQTLLKNAYILQFSEYFMEAAKETGVNPLYLAALSLQEVGSSKSTAISGAQFTYNSKTYSGLYNFYNIGATAGSNPVYRGLVYAGTIPLNDDGTVNEAKRYNRIWDTEQKAIIGGAQFIQKSYMDYGQNTSYFKKWNVVANYQKTLGKDYYNNYTHQYMQNIQAPTSEAQKTYKSYYELDAMNLGFSFYIPVYKNMPEHTELPNKGNPNNRLKNIKIDNVIIDGFESSKFEYTLYVDGTKEVINISSDTINANATVSGTGEKTLVEGENIIELTVTAQNKDIQVYKLIINKAEKQEEEIVYPTVEEILTNANVTHNETYISNLTFTTKTADFNSKILETSSTAIVEVKKGDTVKTTGYLNTGDTISITSGEETKTYTVILYGDVNGDGKINALDLLKIQKHILKTSPLTGAASIASDVNKDGIINPLDLLRVQKTILGDAYISQQ